MSKKKALILAFISTFALLFNNNGRLSTYISSINPPSNFDNLSILVSCWRETGIISVVLVLGLYKLFQFKFPKHPNSKLICVFECCFAFMQLIGISYSTGNSFWIIKYPVLCLILLVGYVCVFHYMIRYILLVIQKDDDQKKCFIKTPNYYFIILLILWSPYLIAFFPGNVFPDALDQLNKYYGYAAWTKHHPPLSTILIGVSNKIGRIIGSDNTGVAIYVVIQMLITAYVFSRCIQYIKENREIRSIEVLVLCYYGAFTVWPSYATCMIKDTIFFDIVVLFFIVLWGVTELNKSLSLLKMIQIVVLGILMCLLRNNGIYMFIAVIPFILMTLKKKGIVIITLISILYLITDTIVWPAMGITKGGTQEALSIPFQQTARYVTLYDEEVTDYERNIIDEVLDYESLKNNYNPNVSDSVKGTYHWAYDANTTMEGEREALKKYFKIWFSMFLKHPKCYVEATVNNIYEYFYVDATSKFSNTGYYGNGMGSAVDIGVFHFSYLLSDGDIFRKDIENFSEILRRLPGIGLLYGAGIYCIIFFFVIFFYIVNKKTKKIAMLLPFLVLILTCLASPVNGAIRYLLPLMGVLPLILIHFVKDYRDFFNDITINNEL